MLEEAPELTDDDRLATVRNLVTTALTMRQYAQPGNTRAVGGTHSTVPRLAMWHVARYFQRTLPDVPQLMAIAREWEETVNRYFAEVLAAGFRDDSDWRAASVDVYVRWCAVTQRWDYFTSGHARAALLWAINENDPLGYHCGMGTYGPARTGAVYDGFSNLAMMQLGAFVYDDPRLRYVANHHPNRDLSIYAQGGFPFGAGTFTPAPDAPEQHPDYLLGLTIVPLSERRHQWDLGAQGRPIPPLAECFDKACLRSGLGTDAQYLLLQGVQCARSINANEIPRFTDRGQVWLISNSSQQGHFCRSALYLSDGRNEGTLPAACRLDAAGRFGDLSMISSTLTDYYGADWQRAVFSAPGEWVLVLDRAVISRPGFYSGQSVWRLALAGTWQDDRTLTATQEGQSFHIIAGAPVAATAGFERPAGGPPDIHENPFVLRERRSGEFGAGEVLDFANLLVTGPAGKPARLEPIRVNHAATLVRPAVGGDVLLGVGGEGCGALGVEADAGLYAVSEEAVYIAGVNRLSIGGRPVLDADRPVTARIDLATGMMVEGADGDELRQSALTWELPEHEATRALDQAAAQELAGLIRARSAEVAPAAVAAPEVARADAPADGGFELLWETDAVGHAGRPPARQAAQRLSSRVMCTL
ncbi:MAG: hypothetical protein AB7Y46_11280 [Armatimonadota bacterium]